MDPENNKIFITGGAGFIGTALIGSLIDRNKITVYDNMWRDSLKNFVWKDHKNLSVIEGDILNVEKLKTAIKGHDTIVHLAAIAGVDTVIKNHTRTMKVNMIGTYNLLEVSLTLDKCCRFIDFSTSEVFGPHAYKPEEGDATSMGAVGEARWTYAVSKLAGEHMAHSYFKEFGLPAVSIRPFNIYGPGQVGEGALHVFVRQAIDNSDITVEGDGDQIRSWCYIDDMINGIKLCLRKKEAIGEVFNIGNPKGTVTILSLAKMVKDISGSSSKIKFVSRDYVDVNLRIPSIIKAKRLLGYMPEVGLEEGIGRTIKWYRKLMENGR